MFEEVRVAPPQALPLVLSREQVATWLGAVQQPRYRTALTLIYHTGLRVVEAVRIELRDLKDTHSDRPRLHNANLLAGGIPVFGLQVTGLAEPQPRAIHRQQESAVLGMRSADGGEPFQ